MSLPFLHFYVTELHTANLKMYYFRYHVCYFRLVATTADPEKKPGLLKFGSRFRYRYEC